MGSKTTLMSNTQCATSEIFTLSSGMSSFPTSLLRLQDQSRLDERPGRQSLLRPVRTSPYTLQKSSPLLLIPLLPTPPNVLNHLTTTRIVYQFLVYRYAEESEPLPTTNLSQIAYLKQVMPSSFPNGFSTGSYLSNLPQSHVEQPGQ